MARFLGRRSVWLWLVLLSVTWVGGAQANPRVREVPDTIADSATRRVVEAIPDTGTELPVVLPRSQDVYLLVTAGGAYTDVRVLGLPTADASRLARALADAEEGTDLAETDVSWSADTYAAAQLVRKRGRLGRRAAANVVPLGAMTGGLRRAGFVPHVLLRVPVYAEGVGLPPAPYSTRRFRWYDGRTLGARPVVVVTTGLSASPLSLWPLALLLLIPLVGVTGLALGSRIARDERQPLEERRRRFRAWAHQAPMLGMLLVVPILLFGLQTSTLNRMADLWLGSGSTVPLVMPLALLVPAVILPLLMTAHRREIALFGKLPGAVAATWLTDKEKELNRRMARWRSVPHIVGAVAIGGAMFLVPHKSPLYSALHPLSQFVMVFGAALVSRLFRSQTAALTKKTLDDDLTFRARRFGQLLGARPREVWVEDSSRASHFAVAHIDRGDHIVVSRKMRDGFTNAEMDFVLAAQVARMVRGKGGTRYWSLLPALLILGLPMAVMFSPHASLSTLVLSPWFLPVLMAVMILPFGLLLISSRATARDNLRREEDADRRALGVTGDLAAAQSALTKTDAEVLPPVTGGLVSSSGTAAQGGGRLAVRRLALQRAGEASFG